MTTPTPNQLKALDILSEIRTTQLKQEGEITYLLSAIGSLIDSITPISEAVEKLQAALSTPRPAGIPIVDPTEGGYVIFTADTLLLSYDDNGAPTYKAKGGQYSKFGVRIWPEILPALEIDPASLKPGPNPFNRKVKAILGEHGPKKIIGLA